MTWPTDRPGDEVRELAIELALPLDVAERVLAYGKQERRAGYDIALTEVEQGVALPATICNHIDAAVQAERAIADRLACAAEAMPRATPAPGDSGTPHQFMIEAGVVWELDAALKRFRSRGPTPALDGRLAEEFHKGWLKGKQDELDAAQPQIAALDAALAQARRETWARAAEIAERVAIPEDCHGVEAHGRLMAAHAAADAIRSAAAGEEGK